MSEAATTTPDPNVSTRTLADVKQHRRARVAEMLRQYADRIEHSGDVEIAVVGFEREIEDITPEGAERREVRPRRGQAGDEVIVLSLQLTTYEALAAAAATEPDPED